MLDTTSNPSPRSTAVWIRLGIIFLPTALLLGLVVLGFYYQDIANEDILYAQAGSSIVDSQADIIMRENSAVESDLLYLADQSILRAFVSGDRSAKADLAHEYLLFCRQKGIYDQIRYLDGTGREIIRINDNDRQPSIVPDKDLQAKAARYYFGQAMQLDRGEVFVSPFDLNVEHEQIEQPLKPTIRFATPVFDRDGHKAGVLILNYLGQALLDKLAEVSTGIAGKTFLLNGSDYFLRGPTQDTEWAFMFNRGPTFGELFPGTSQMPLGTDRSQTRTDQGLFTIRTLLPPRALSKVPPEVTGRGPRNATLRVVSYIPDTVLRGRTRELLGRMLLIYGLALVLILVLAWYLAYAAAQRRYQQHSLEASEARLRALSTQLITAQEDERRRLARDLHDEMGQVVTSMSLDLQRTLQATEPGKQQELIGRALHGAETLLARIHEISTQLRPTLLDDLGLKEAIQSYLGEYERVTGILPQAVLRFDHTNVSTIVSQNVFRIVQEALTNVAKHSRATEVQIELHVTTEQVTLTVRDDGVGFAPAALDGRRLGMLGMRERAELLDGSFSVRSAPGKGTQLAATIPIRPA